MLIDTMINLRHFEGNQEAKVAVVETLTLVEHSPNLLVYHNAVMHYKA